MKERPYKLLIAAVILALTFLVFALGKSPIFRVDRAGAAIIGATLTIATDTLSFDEAAASVDHRTIVLLFSMMIVTANLKLSGFFTLFGNFILKHIQTRQQLLAAVIAASGLLSALFINDIVCLLFTPVVIMLCHQAQVDALPYLIALATASNIGSAATLIGNPQNILIGSLSNIGFTPYAAIAAPLSILGLAINYFIVRLLYPAATAGNLSLLPPEHSVVLAPLVRKSLGVTFAILVGFIAGFDPVIVACLGAAYLLITRRIKPNKIYASIDFNLLVIFIGLFVVIGGVEHSGLMQWLMQKLSFIDFANFTIFSLLTIVLSNIFSNVPAVLLLQFFLPSGATSAWWAGMAVFSTLAGNLTITGSIANLIVAEIAKRENITIDFGDYLKVGLPLTLILCLLSLVYFKLLVL